MTAKRWLTLGSLAVLLVLLGLVTASHGGDKKEDDERITCLIGYIPTPHPVAIKMMQMANITKDDVVYDLGCGDGRLVSLAVGSEYFCLEGDNYVKRQSPFRARRGVGVDIDPDRMKDTQETLAKNGFSNIKAERDSRGIKKLTAVLKRIDGDVQ